MKVLIIFATLLVLSYADIVKKGKCPEPSKQAVKMPLSQFCNGDFQTVALLAPSDLQIGTCYRAKMAMKGKECEVKIAYQPHVNVELKTETYTLKETNEHGRFDLTQNGQVVGYVMVIKTTPDANMAYICRKDSIADQIRENMVVLKRSPDFTDKDKTDAQQGCNDYKISCGNNLRSVKQDSSGCKKVIEVIGA